MNLLSTPADISSKDVPLREQEGNCFDPAYAN